MLSGRDLFEYKRDLFKDDEDADDTPATTESTNSASPSELIDEDVKNVASKVQSDLFLDGEDDDLDDLDDLDDE